MQFHPNLLHKSAPDTLSTVIQFVYMGRTDYSDALALQSRLAELRADGRIANTLLLLEHPPVLTLGRNATRENILASDEMLAVRGVEVHQIKRGGDVTYHGPGQLVGYPIFDLRSLNHSGVRMGPVDFVRFMEEALIKLTALHGIYAGRIAGLTGVWCGLAEQYSVGRKIAAIGIHVSRGIVTHGFAYNLTTRLEDFQLINPCGITDRPVTNLELEMKRAKIDAPMPTLESLAEDAARQFGAVLGEEMVRIECAELEAEVCR